VGFIKRLVRYSEHLAKSRELHVYEAFQLALFLGVASELQARTAYSGPPSLNPGTKVQGLLAFVGNATGDLERSGGNPLGSTIR
jgi:hypothetical protein